MICAATSTVEPIVRRGDVRPGVHVASVGYIANGREVDEALLRAALVAVEHRDTTLRPFPIGSNDPGRTHDDQLTVFKSVGVAVADGL